jgi:hypothetical protein
MIKMRLDFAEKLLKEGRAFGHELISQHDGIVVMDDDNYPYDKGYYATQLNDGKFEVDSEGFVAFHLTTPVINEHTRWNF